MVILCQDEGGVAAWLEPQHGASREERCSIVLVFTQLFAPQISDAMVPGCCAPTYSYIPTAHLAPVLRALRTGI